MKKKHTAEDVLKHDPCWDHDEVRRRFEAVGGSATFEEIARAIDPADVVWLASRLLSDKEAHLFACWCAEKALVPTSDPRSHEAVAVAKRYALGDATDEELTAARSAAGSAAWAAWSAARSAAESVAAWSAAESAARSAARSAADAAWSAAWAAESAAGSAAGSAAWAAESAARSAAWAAWSAAESAESAAARSAAESAQVEQLIKIMP